jgi:hypothetical protein
VSYTQRVLGYLHALSAADVDQPPLLRGPLVCWDEGTIHGATAEELCTAFEALIDYIRSSNPLVQKYFTMAERDWGGSDAQVWPYSADTIITLAFVAEMCRL